MTSSRKRCAPRMFGVLFFTTEIRRRRVSRTRRDKEEKGEQDKEDVVVVSGLDTKQQIRAADIHDCYLDLFETHLHFVSNNPSGLTYQGTLPLKELTVCNLQQNGNHSQPQEFAFQINGVSLNPIIVYCANQDQLDLWFGLMKQSIEANGGTATAPENYTRVKVNKEVRAEGREELRNSINREPIYEWEGSQRDSLGAIVYVTKVRLQHLPCQEQSDRLLVMYPATLIILSEESNGLFYKGKLPLNMITVTTPCQDVKPNTFRIEGKLINPIVVSCRDKAELCDWIQQFKGADVPVLSPPPPVYDIIYTPTSRESPQFDRWSGSNSSQQGKIDAMKLRLSQSGNRGSHHLQFPVPEDEDPLSPGYSEPLCYSRPSSAETARMGSRSNSVSSHSRPERDHGPLSRRYSSPQRNSHLHVPLEGQSLSQVYGPPQYSGQYRAGPHWMEKAPLIKSNSWSTPQSSLSYSLSAIQRHSDLCHPRQPLSPLWQESVQSGHPQQNPAPPPSTFQLSTPPLGKRCRRSLVLTNSQGHTLGPELEPARRASSSVGGGQHQRVEAVSRLKLLTTPCPPVQEQRLIPPSFMTNSSQMPYSYSPDYNSYLQPTEPDDQEMDYDNIWEYDNNTGMIQPMSGISPHRTGLDFGGQRP
ncbi:hypothetical protein NHX12_012567 [Muraenolepis orangiensis]|uniref:PH domain-containing protein n=1 Tax=Muraenolepis orangiensis TaxID=630683 RepID=A0A9Q0I784_9TELE|nr:hypothetical protein NHX12_012567 [Muraenolepis orangiensis]